MKTWKLLVAAALLAIISGAAVSIPIPEDANPAIYGQWNFELTVETGVLSPDPKGANGECVFVGDLHLKNDLPNPIKDTSIIGEPVTGDAQMALVSGDCGDFNGVINGSAAGNSIFMNLNVFPTGPAKGDPLIILSLEGQLYDDDLMSGAVTGAIVPNSKGSFGNWRATRTASVPTLTPVGILALLAGLGLVGGIALRRRK